MEDQIPTKNDVVAPQSNNNNKKKRKKKNQTQKATDPTPTTEQNMMKDQNQVKKNKKRKLNQTQKESDPTEEEQTNNNKKKKHSLKAKEVAIFGNYRNYYGYRIDQGLEEDPRMKVMKKEWFEGKNCLDIGCNSGLITITLAKKFGCQKILGIDIDSARIEDAHWNLRNIVKRSELNNLAATKRSKDGKRNAITNSPEETSSQISESPDSYLFDIVSFQKDNFVQGLSSPGDKVYDTILCLSVSKWIHLNWGDEGLITLFSKVWRLLKPGGVFILEPQPWKSYISNRLVSQVASTNFNKFEIFPNQFQEILLDKIGFRKIENISASLSGSKTGFNRPILALWK